MIGTNWRAIGLTVVHKAFPSQPGVAADPFDPFTLPAAGSRFTFYPRGADRLEALIELIEGAHDTLDAFYFEYDPDETGIRMRDALVAAARRGVRVRLYVDAFGSGAQPDFFSDLVDAGGTFNRFQARWNIRFLIRNHQKMAIADGERVMSGGFNIADAYFAPPQDFGWTDLGVRIEGALTQRFAAWFALIHEWMTADGSEFRRIRSLVRDWDGGEGPVQLLLGGPTTVTSSWARAFKRDLVHSERTDIVTAYFSPPRSVRRALRRAARHARLRMILARWSDAQITVRAARLHYKRMVRNGAALFEYLPTKLHMKLIILDNVAYIGSGNLDMRSVRLNLELMIRVEDAPIADRLRVLIDALEAESRPVDSAWLAEHGGVVNRLRSLWASAMMRFVDYKLARSLNLGAPSRANTRAHED
ncbi:MAG: phosphatidylserine/phosphatidylglycerophosphate/cardiolipin synthase family protein [Pseudomonadota bacterium]